MDKEKLLEQFQQQGFSQKIIDAFSRVNREDFLPDLYREDAYKDVALPIGYGQTISQPSTIAFMLEKLGTENGQKILEVGSGSGYVLALMNEIVENAEIYGSERIAELINASRYNLKKHQNIKIVHTPDALGIPAYAPFDRILVSAAAEKSVPPELIDQLK
ncbi:MAG TPA: protein-L-isoaspartate O-methyltransferase, partial [Patescibacteria group bacterium]|nr:protein-L-isoaspartate O-methyltransferase [Patescibacteria group bacterium]